MQARGLKTILLGCTILTIAMGVAAHPEPGRACVAPLRPTDEHNDALWQAFLNEVDAYRDCVNERKNFHEAAVRAHQDRARAAVEKWNQFVRSSLNAPEDFPWPASAQQRPSARPPVNKAPVKQHDAFLPPATPLLE